jgi:3-oxoadipate enol-lactonase
VLWDAMRPTLFAAHAPADLLESARAWTLEQDPEQIVRALAVLRDRRDTTDILKLVDPHPLAVLGELDEIARPADFNGVLLEERVLVVRETGHLPMLEKPDRFDPILEEFLRSTA